MNLLPAELATVIRRALQAAQSAGDLPEFEIPDVLPIQRSAKPEMGDYASPVAMQLAKAARRKPLDIAQAIANHAVLPDFVAAFEAAPPGYLNVRLSEEWVVWPGGRHHRRRGKCCRTDDRAGEARPGRMRERQPDRSADGRAHA